jgi:hypothetical protein
MGSLHSIPSPDEYTKPVNSSNQSTWNTPSPSTTITGSLADPDWDKLVGSDQFTVDCAFTGDARFPLARRSSKIIPSKIKNAFLLFMVRWAKFIGFIISLFKGYWFPG